MQRDPSATGACDECHPAIAASNANSLHTNLWGEKALVEQRGQCAIEDYAAGFGANCASCHTTCGQCHISRPNSAGGGLIRNGGHLVRRTPHMTEQCTACHGSRIAHDYLGEGAGNFPDAHYSRGYLCNDCHTGQEIHGDGMSTNASGHYEHRYEVETMPRCETCHSGAAGGSGNTYHTVHAGPDPVVGVTLQCQVCHSQSYKNCTSCHTQQPTGFTIDPSVLTLKIGKNTIPGERDYDYTIVRHVPVDQQTYASWGLTSLPGFDSVPTWKYASPHNVRKLTDQTTPVGGGGCGSSCHDHPGSVQGFYLRESDIAGQPDATANQGVVILEGDLH